MVVLAGCGDGLPRPSATLNPPNPLSKGEGPAHMTSPRPSPGGEGVDSPALTGTPNPPAYGHPLKRGKAAHEALVGIDSLMWKQPDSALKVMMEFAGSPEADSLNEFEGHYCQVMVAELLFKNYYGQSNREEVLKAVHYFDSIVGMDGADARGKADTRGVSVQRDAFLAARAHYINGVGYYERDSLIEACGEYLCALRMMEGHFGKKELVGKKARFMALTYNRLGDLFSEQYMQEAAIYCIKRSLIFDRIAHSSPSNIANILYHLGKQYDKLNEADSAAYYYDKASDLIHDRNTMLYRDVVTSKALFECKVYGNIAIALDSMKSMAAQATSDTERLNRFLTIGGVYKSLGQYDSAKVYLEPVFERDPDRVIIAARYLREIALIEGDTLKANQYSQILAEDAAAAPENLFRASQLNDLFQNYLHGKQEKAEAERRLAEQEAARLRWKRGLAVTVVVMMALGLGLWWWLAKRKKEHEAETHTWHMEKQQLQTQVDDALQQLQTQADDALQQARAMLPQRVNEIYSSKEENRLERIMDEFEAAYPEAMRRVAAAYPDLTPTERRIFVLSHLQFRAKEMADLLGLSENTVNQYRYNLRKKTENTSFSAFLD